MSHRKERIRRDIDSHGVITLLARKKIGGCVRGAENKTFTLHSRMLKVMMEGWRREREKEREAVACKNSYRESWCRSVANRNNQEATCHLKGYKRVRQTFLSC